MSAGNYRKENDCLNCGAIVEKHFCSSCGQPNLELKESFWSFVTHSIGHYFHFDNKFLTTLKPLLTKPGQVTLDYMAGKRARYINPVSMYIFVSIVYFIIVPQAYHKIDDKGKINIEESFKKGEVDSLKKSLKTEISKSSTPIEKLAVSRVLREISLKEIDDLNIQELEIKIADLKKQLSVKSTDSLLEELEEYENGLYVKLDTTVLAYENRQSKLSAADKDGFVKRVVKKREIVLNEKTKDGKWSFKEEIEHYKPKQYFLLMPLFALFIMWSFRKNKIYYLDHLIFTIHCMTAFFIVQIITVPLKVYVFGVDSIISSLISLGIFSLILWYLYNGLQLFYQRGKKKTIHKMITIFILFGLASWISGMIIKQYIYYVIV